MLPAGDTFLLRKAMNWVDHLWILLLDSEESGKTIMVNLTTKKWHHKDLTTVLNIGDHPFIKRESIINYSDAVEVDVNLLEKAFEMGLATGQDPCSGELLKEIQKGLLDSRFTKNKLKDYYRRRRGLKS